MAGDANRQPEQIERDGRPTVLHLRSSAPEYLHFLSRRFRLINSWESPLPTADFVANHSDGVRAMVVSGTTPTGADLLALLPDLKFLATTSTGTNHIDLAECRRRGISVAYAGGVFCVDTADYAIGLLIDVMRRVSAGERYVRSGPWPARGDFSLGFKLSGRRVGIVGLGNIGSEIAKRLEGFSCTVSYNSRQKKPWIPYPFYSNIHELAAQNDVLMLCCALNNETQHIINRDVLLALGRDGIVVNVGRGALIDEKELVRCLLCGEIGGAGLDVFEDEPNVPSELFNLDNVVLSPHRGAFTSEGIEDFGKLIAANLDAFFSNKPLITAVKFAAADCVV